MGRLKSYLKRLSENGLLENVRPADVPINKLKHTNPTYLTKEEMKLVFKQLDKQLDLMLFRKNKRDYKYNAFMLRAMVHLLYATGLRNAELRRLKPSDIDICNMRGIVIGK